jgi:hypothetical protein
MVVGDIQRFGLWFTEFGYELIFAHTGRRFKVVGIDALVAAQ